VIWNSQESRSGVLPENRGAPFPVAPAQMNGSPLPLQPPASNPPGCKVQVPEGCERRLAAVKEPLLSGMFARPLMESVRLPGPPSRNCAESNASLAGGAE